MGFWYVWHVLFDLYVLVCSFCRRRTQMAGGGCGGTARYPSFESYHRQLLTHVMFGVLFLPRVGSFEMGWILLRTLRGGNSSMVMDERV